MAEFCTCCAKPIGKKCSKCNETKLLSEFNNSKNVCKVCIKKYNNDRYENVIKVRNLENKKVKEILKAFKKKQIINKDNKKDNIINVDENDEIVTKNDDKEENNE